MIGVAEMKNLGRAGLDARGLHADFGSVRAEIAFVGDVVVVAPDGGVRAGGFAFTGVLAAVWVNANHAARIVVNGVIRAGFEAGRVFALHAQRWQEIAGDFGVGAVLPVINLGAEAGEGTLFSTLQATEQAWQPMQRSTSSASFQRGFAVLGVDMKTLDDQVSGNRGG